MYCVGRSAGEAAEPHRSLIKATIATYVEDRIAIHVQSHGLVTRRTHFELRRLLDHETLLEETVSWGTGSLPTSFSLLVFLFESVLMAITSCA